MLPRPLRIFAALLAVALFLGSVGALVVAPSGLYALAFVPAFALTALAMYTGARPAPSDLPRIEEQLRRFRGAMFLCFGAAAAAYVVVVTRHAASLASLAAALWLVAFVLMFFVAYYRTQRRLALQVE